MPAFSSVLLFAALPAFAAEVSVTEKGHASNPAWSPDGAQLAFEVNDYSGNIALYVSKVGNGNPMGTPSRADLPGAKSSFGGSGSLAANPSWHPEGALMFEGASAGGSMRLYFWQPGAGMPGELLGSSLIAGDLTWPCVSPDGSKLAFVSDSTGKGDIYIWDRASNTVARSMTSEFTEAAPRYHASGSTLAYSRKNQGGEDIFTVTDGASTPRVGGNGDQTRPIFSGENIVFFTSERGDGHWDIAVSAGAGNKKIIAKDVRLPVRAAPALTPDGQWVAYGTDNAEKGNIIYFTRIDGSATVQVDTGYVAAGEPAITSVGGRMFMAFTALPDAGADWRKLHIVDISGKL